MKKTSLLLLFAAYILDGCNTNTTQVNTNTAASGKITDTSHIRVVQQPQDTSIKDGKVTKLYPNGIIKEKDYYKNGKREGECLSFYPSGKMQSDDFFTNGLIDGLSTVFYENGQKRYEGNFVKGKPVGLWKFWDEKGKLIRTLTYGKKEGTPNM